MKSFLSATRSGDTAAMAAAFQEALEHCDSEDQPQENDEDQEEEV